MMKLNNDNFDNSVGILRMWMAQWLRKVVREIGNLICDERLSDAWE